MGSAKVTEGRRDGGADAREDLLERADFWGSLFKETGGGAFPLGTRGPKLKEGAVECVFSYSEQYCRDAVSAKRTRQFEGDVITGGRRRSRADEAEKKDDNYSCAMSDM